MATVVLDPGHGGKVTKGHSSPNNARGPSGLLEKTVVLDIAMRMVPRLEHRGHRVVLTRKTDDNVGLVDRAGTARSIAAPVFLSIHLNGFNGKAQGSETFCHDRHGGHSADLCRAVQKRLVAATGLTDRNKGHPGGVKRQALAVLNPSAHHAKTACCLTEISFMDVPAEEARLKTGVYLDAIATALVDGICDYLSLAGLEKTGSTKEFGDSMEAEGVTAPPPEIPDGPTAEILPDEAPESSMNDVGEDSPPSSPMVDGSAAMLKAAVATGDFPMADFTAYVTSLKLRHFSARELLTLGGQNDFGGCRGLNSYPPRELWPNIAQTARMLDEIRHRLGARCFINSAYRNLAYNSCVGGERASLHTRFNAIDFRCEKGTAHQWHAVAVAVRASNPAFMGGIGRYSSFVHIDTRGRKADW